MSNTPITNVNVISQELLPTPAEIKSRLPLDEAAEKAVLSGRQTIRDILDHKDHRLFVVVGPCSIHDPEAALDYARHLRKLAEEVKDSIYIVMRVYFEKPRTTVGWKGLINDPKMDDSFDIKEGLYIARKLLPDIARPAPPTAPVDHLRAAPPTATGPAMVRPIFNRRIP